MDLLLFFYVFLFQSPYRTVLKDIAIPTMFDLTSHLKNPHNRHRKQIKELVRNCNPQNYSNAALFCDLISIKVLSTYFPDGGGFKED